MKIKIFIFCFSMVFILSFLNPIIVLAAHDSVQYNGEAYLFSGSSFCLLINPGAKLSTSYASDELPFGRIVLTGAYLDSNNYSSITLISPAREILTNSLNIETNCETTQSKLTITWGPETPEMVTIIPSGAYCSGGVGDASICLREQSINIPVLIIPTWTAPYNYEYISELSKIKLYRGTIVEPGTNKKYGYPKIHSSVREKLLNSAVPYEYISSPFKLNQYKNIIGVTEKYGIPKNVWTVPGGYEHIRMPYMISLYKNIIKEPNSLRLWGIRK